MHLGKTVFAQLMDFIPAHEFRRCVNRYQGNRKVSSFSCWDQFLSMAFAQLTYRESLRDIETCLRAFGSRLYHLGIRGRVSRSTLADANETRDYRIYADLAQVLIATARPLYAGEDFGVDLDQTVYALDCTTIDLCLSLFPWARYRAYNAAVKLHTLLDLEGNIPAFIDVKPAKIHEIHVRDELLPEPGSIYIMDRAYLDFEAFTVCIKPWPSSSSARAKISAFTVSPPVPSTSSVACAAIKPFASRVFIPPSSTPTCCVAFVITMPKPRRPWFS